MEAFSFKRCKISSRCEGKHFHCFCVGCKNQKNRRTQVCWHPMQVDQMSLQKSAQNVAQPVFIKINA
jgi:hypothetical protein